MTQKIPILKSLILFYKNPSLENQDTQISFWQKLKCIFLGLGFHIFLAGGISILGVIILEAIGYQGKNQIETILDTLPLWLFILLVVFLGPLREELTFRLWLTKKLIPFILGFGLFLYLICYYLLTFVLEILNLKSEEAFRVVFWSSLVVSVLFMMISAFKSRQLKEFLIKFASGAFQIKFKNLLFLNVALFAFIHILNYSYLDQIWWLLPILTAPQLLAGIWISYFKIRFSFFWGLAFHALLNFSALFLFLVLFLNKYGFEAVFSPLDLSTDFSNAFILSEVPKIAILLPTVLFFIWVFYSFFKVSLDYFSYKN
jgi:hypothetical protein